MTRPYSPKDLNKLIKVPTENFALVALTNRINDATSLYRLALQHGDETSKNEATKNCIVAFASGLEVFCKEIIIQYAGKWNSKGLSELLKEKVSLNDAYELFKEREVKREVLISHYNSFQNIDDICKVFDILTNKKFFNEIEKLKFIKIESGHSNLKEVFSKWRSDLSIVYATRHKIIHENNSAIDLQKESDGTVHYSGLVYLVSVAMIKYLNDNHFKD